MTYQGNDVVQLYLLKDRTKGKMLSSDNAEELMWRNPDEHEQMWRLLNYLSLECSAAVICSEFNTLQRYLGRDSQHLLKSTMEKEKKKTDVEDLKPPVVGMCPCGTCGDVECTIMTDGLRTLTFAFSKIQNPSS